MRSRVALAVAVVAAVLASAAPAGAAAPQLAVSGNKLLDLSTQQTFIPRGVNWPSFEYACYYGYGYSNEESDTSVGPTAKDAALIASWHVNIVRVPLNQDCWLGDDGSPSGGFTAAGYRAAVEAWVAELHRAGLAVIVDLHWSGPDGVKAEGQRMMADDRSPAFWTSVATAFKDDRSIIFDAFNEPYSRYENDQLAYGLGWDCWRDGGCKAPVENDMTEPLSGKTFTVTGMSALLAAIRGAGATQPVMLGGLDYANDLREWLTHLPADDQLVASFHNYDGQRCEAQSCWDAEIAPIAAKVPVITGEFGETDCKDTHDTSYMDWADAHGVGYLMWQWVVLQPDELADPPCASLRIISDVNGTPAAPNGTALKAHLDALAAGGGGGGGGTPTGPSGPTGGGGGGGTGTTTTPGTTPAPSVPPPTTTTTKPPTATDATAPTLSGAKLTRKRGRVTLSLTLSEPAKLKLTLQRRKKGRYRALLTSTRSLKKGTTTLTVTRRRLGAGRYHLTLKATDVAGNAAKTRTLSLRVR